MADEPQASSVLAPITQDGNLREKARVAIQGAIVIGELHPGRIYSVRTLSQTFGISNTPIREAVLDLERLGFVRVLRNQGFLVTQPDRAQIERIVHIRLLLESPTVRDLAGTIDEGTLTELRGIADRQIRETREGDMEARRATELDFHVRLVGLAGNPELTELVGNLRMQTRVPDLVPLRRAGELVRADAEHVELLDLLARGERDAVEALMRRHVSHVLEWMDSA